MRGQSARSRLGPVVGRGLVIVLLCSVALVPEAMRFISSRTAQTGGGDTQPAAATGPHFAIRGHVKGLYPGARKSVILKIENPNPYPIKVGSLRIIVGRPDRAGCSARALRPKEGIRLGLLVPKKSRAFASYPIKLRRAAKNKCQGARWPLVFRGRAVRRSSS